VTPIINQLNARVADALSRVGPGLADTDPVLRPTQDPRFGDYQANCAMALAKQLKIKPRELAEKIVAHLDLADMCEPPSLAGPGFINLTLSPAFVARALQQIQTDPRLGVPTADSHRRIVVDYSGVNVAKLMHVGHLRSTIVGDSIVRLLEFAGHEVIRRNHVGDWGLQMGMVLHAVGDQLAQLETQHGLDAEGQRAIIGELAGGLEGIERAYKQVTDLFARDRSVEQGCRELLHALQNHADPAYRRWQWVRQATLEACEAIYDRLGVRLRPEDVQGESAYAEDYAPMLAELQQRRLAVDDAGALCMFLRDEQGRPLFTAKDGSELPLIIRKGDGTYLYSTFDLAALRYRGRHFQPDQIIYVHDSRQAQHFAMVFQGARRAEYVGPEVSLEFIPFGTVLGPDRKPFKTREGKAVRLDSLLDEAEQHARQIVDQNSPEMPADRRAEIAARVGVGAVKYNDLAHNIASDYVFSWDKMLAMDGNTAPYMMYAYARVQSIGRKGEVDYQQLDPDTRITLDSPAELALGKKLVQFGETVATAAGTQSRPGREAAATTPAPNVLTTYLFETAQAFSGFYKDCPVLKAGDGALRDSRLRLCDLTARTLQTGLGLLGIDTVDRM